MDLYKQSISSLPGIGPKRAKLFEKLGVFTLGGLLAYYPHDYIDLSEPCRVAAAPFDEPCAIRVKVTEKLPPETHREFTVYTAIARDDSSSLKIKFFNAKYPIESLKIGGEYLLYGRVRGGFNMREIASPEIFEPAGTPPFAACYSLTKGLGNAALRRVIKQALGWVDQYPEILDRGVRERYKLPDIRESLRNIHRPQSREALDAAKRRLMFDELYTLAAGVMMLRHHARSAVCDAFEARDMSAFYSALPFEPTSAQRRAIDEICADMRKTHPANRIIEGDVGSGKTAVAAAAAYYAAMNARQSALMAPTELLASQHYDGLCPLLGQKLGMRLALLTGATPAGERKQILNGLAAGEIDLCIGTHALISQGVDFARLGLVITDEQHRFGVAQRARLGRKGERPHTLVMSATPIPRTLALTIYGELDVSVLDELPPGRQKILTYKISSPKRERALAFIRGHLQKGLQAYIVCPIIGGDDEASAIDDGEKDGAQPMQAVAYAGQLKQGALKGFEVGLLHGKMKPKQKDEVMEAFSRGEIQALVSTTVVEVGIDVPNAVIMMVENAERFGLSQLHQLRGRVGRGKAQSYCILLSDSTSQQARDRLKMMCNCSDGFALAEYDLRTRGPGNFLGRQQHGLPVLRMAVDCSDSQLQAARRAAMESLKDDAALASPEHMPLRSAVERLVAAAGERLN